MHRGRITLYLLLGLNLPVLFSSAWYFAECTQSVVVDQDMLSAFPKLTAPIVAGASGEFEVPLSRSMKSKLLQQNPFFDSFFYDDFEDFDALSSLMYLHVATPNQEITWHTTGKDPYLLIFENGSFITSHAHRSVEHKAERSRGDLIGVLSILYSHTPEIKVFTLETSYFWRMRGEDLRTLTSGHARLREYFEKKSLVSFLRHVRKRPLILIPGFASTQLVAWKEKACLGIDIEIGERLWVNLEKILNSRILGPACWLECMLLDIVEQTDPPDCKLRPDQGLASVSELSPGLFGGVTTIFRSLIYTAASEFGYDISNILAVPYDWRLAPLRLEQRDLFFSKLKMSIEHTVALNGGNPAIAICHSLGNNVFLYFTKWLEYHYPQEHLMWLDQHIWMYVAFGPPLLGGVEPLRAIISGIDFGLPMRAQDARQMAASFSSSLWMLPFVAQTCALWSEALQAERPARFPNPIIIVDLANGTTRRFGVPDIATGSFFLEMGNLTGDPTYALLYDSLRLHYHQDPVWKMFDPVGPQRPPVRKVMSLYGINLPTPVAYRYAIHADKSVHLVEIHHEDTGGLVFSRSAGSFDFFNMLAQGDPKFSHYHKSGDESVPYASLAWSHSWHYPNVTMMSHPARMQAGLEGLEDILVEPAYSIYESFQESEAGQRETVVVEIDQMGHRDLVRNRFAIRLIEQSVFDRLRYDLLGRMSNQ